MFAFANLRITTHMTETIVNASCTDKRMSGSYSMTLGHCPFRHAYESFVRVDEDQIIRTTLPRSCHRVFVSVVDSADLPAVLESESNSADRDVCYSP